MTFGRNIRRLRWDAGIRTQRGLADLLGVPQPQVSDWENDRYGTLETMTLVRIAKGLRCSVDQLLAGIDADYDRVRESRGTRAAETAGDDGYSRRPCAAPACAANRHCADIPVVAEGGGSWRILDDARRSGGADVVQWVSRPPDLSDPDAYGVRIRSDAMLPAYRPNTVAIVAPGRRVQGGDEVYAALASGERLIRQTQPVRGGFLLQAYNRAYRTRVVDRKDVLGMDVVVSSRLARF